MHLGNFFYKEFEKNKIEIIETSFSFQIVRIIFYEICSVFIKFRSFNNIMLNKYVLLFDVLIICCISLC